MPLYEYECKKCKNRFEKLRPINQSSEGAQCPSCNELAERVISRFCSFSADESGLSTPIAGGGGGGCGGCSSTGCGSCGV